MSNMDRECDICGGLDAWYCVARWCGYECGEIEFIYVCAMCITDQDGWKCDECKRDKKIKEVLGE